MVKRICPICDHVMKGSHYCHFCRQWIRHPNQVNATYYLNERHPEHETNCEYHQAPRGRAVSGQTKTAPEGYRGGVRYRDGKWQKGRNEFPAAAPGKKASSREEAAGWFSRMWNKSMAHRALCIFFLIIGLNVLIQFVMIVLAVLMGILL